MAQIRVEPKGNNNRSIWPWILGALLLIGLIWGITRYTSDDDRSIEANTERTIIDNGEARPAAPERVRNESYEDNGTLDNTNEMRDDRVLEGDSVIDNR